MRAELGPLLPAKSEKICDAISNVEAIAEF